MDDKQLRTIAQDVGQWLRGRDERLALAESCTGGWIAKILTDIPGSSAWFNCGWVCYSDMAKQVQLGVQADTLARHGAVSEEVAGELAQGALMRSGARWAIAVSGIAGPDGGSASKPVGTVCFAWAGSDGVLFSETCHFKGDREQVRRQTVAHALARLISL